MSQDTNISQLVINKLTKQQYDSIVTPNESELYLITDDVGITDTDIIAALGYTPQEELVSGTNIKTINNTSLLGNGNIEIQGGGSITIDQTYDPTSANAQSGVAIAGANFLTASSLNNYVTTNTDQNITGTKTFVGQKKIGFKQSASNNKLGFTLYDNNNVEKGYLEFNPTNTIDGAPLMTLGNYASAADGITHVGFRKYSSISGANGAYNLLTPLISDAKTPFNLTTTYTNFYLPLGFTDGTTTVKTAKSGMVDLSSIIPTVNNSTITFTQGGVTKGTITLNQASNGTIALDAGGTVDQTYSPTSQNAQSGVAIEGELTTHYVKSSVENTTQGTTASIGYLNGFAPLMQLNYGNYQMFCGCAEGAMLGIIDTTAGTETGIAAIPTGIMIEQGEQQATLTLSSNNNLLVNGSELLTSSAIANMQTTGNLVTSISSSSTDSQYPSAKCVYDLIGNIETLLQAV